MLADHRSSAGALEAATAVLLDAWDGPHGGLPPFDRATPESIEAAYRIATERKRSEVRHIARNTEAPTFENTVLALENSGAELRRVDPVYRVFAATMTSPEMREIDERLAPLLPALEDEIAHDEMLFARIEAVHASATETGLDVDARRLTDVLRMRMLRRGAALTPAQKAKLGDINARIAVLQGRFNQNLTLEKDEQYVVIEREEQLEGLSERARVDASDSAGKRGVAGWVINNERPEVMNALMTANDRELRERVWRMWFARGANSGTYDNRPIVAELLELRGKKARLLGYPNFAAYALAERMALTPERALAQIRAVWERVSAATASHLAELQKLADADGITTPLAPWDRYHYAERLRRAKHGLDREALKSFFSLEAMLRAMFWSAGRLYGVTLREMPGAPVYHPDVRAFSVERNGEPIGAVWFDLLLRPGKMHGSWQMELRAARATGERVYPLSLVASGMPAANDGGPTLLSWEHARVLFHEFGHALHMLLNQSAYPSLGSMAVAWDAIEIPSLLNERWLEDRELLGTFAKHATTGEALPLQTIEQIEGVVLDDRVFSVTLDYLATATVDLRVHLAADGSPVDALQIEREVLAELAMPDAIDPMMRVSQSYHGFATDHYPAGIYVYLWADVIAADAAEAFFESPGGIYDRDTAERFRASFLSVGNTVRADRAYRAFRGRDPDPEALSRRFALASK